MVSEAGPHTAPPPTAAEEIRISGSRPWTDLGLIELWEYRELVLFMTWRDLLVRYKQTVIGAGWAILQPVMTMIIFTVVFGRIAKMPSDGLPYPVFSLAALVPWSFFADSVLRASESTVAQAHIIKKIYFPRMALPIAPILARSVDFCLSFAVLVAVMAGYGIVPTANVIWLPLFVLLAGITALAISLWLSAMNVQFRDVRMVAPFIVQSWLFLTPIAWPSSELAEPWRTLYALNPMAGVVEGFRWALLSSGPAPGAMILVSTASSILLLIGGTIFFRRMERSFADVV